jgi:hypothetical protein
MQWITRQPRVYRFLEKKYVDQFFQTGLLRLSSFARFSKHEDEARLDGKEGTFSFHYQPPGSGEIVIGNGCVGADAYVLCASLVPSADVMRGFKADSAIVVNDPRGFALAVAASIPNFAFGFDGPCSYQARRDIHRNFFSATDAPDIPLDLSGALDRSRLLDLMKSVGERDAYFLKHFSHMPQNEWRFIWITSGQLNDYIEVEVPEARNFCEPWSNSTNYIAFNENGALPPPNGY